MNYIKKILHKINVICHISILKFLHYNFFCRNIKADKGCYIIPYRRTCISIAATAKIFLHGSMFLNCNKLPSSKAECLILLRDGARLTVNGPVRLYYGTTLQIHDNAELTVGDLGMNTGSVLVCGYKMTIGSLVSTAREVFIFDSDHHPVFNEKGERINEAKEVVIGDNVWIGLKSLIMKGSHIESGSVISAHSLVTGNVPGHVIVASPPARPVMKDISWHR